MSQTINEPIDHMELAQTNLMRAVEMLNEKIPYKDLDLSFQNLVREAQYHCQTAIGLETVKRIGIGGYLQLVMDKAEKRALGGK